MRRLRNVGGMSNCGTRLTVMRCKYHIIDLMPGLITKGDESEKYPARVELYSLRLLPRVDWDDGAVSRGRRLRWSLRRWRRLSGCQDRCRAQCRRGLAAPGKAHHHGFRFHTTGPLVRGPRVQNRTETRASTPNLLIGRAASCSGGEGRFPTLTVSHGQRPRW